MLLCSVDAAPAKPDVDLLDLRERFEYALTGELSGQPTGFHTAAGVSDELSGALGSPGPFGLDPVSGA